MLNKDNLIQYFSDGIKLKGFEKIGTEHEKFIYSKKDLSLIPFHGERSISSVLKKFIENGWDPIIEDEQIVGANKNQASITLEPGGQFELSGAPLNNLHETCREINDHLSFTKYSRTTKAIQPATPPIGLSGLKSQAGPALCKSKTPWLSRNQPPTAPPCRPTAPHSTP